MESINTVCENTNICNVWTEKKNVYRKMGNGIAFAGKQRYVDIFGPTNHCPGVPVTARSRNLLPGDKIKTCRVTEQVFLYFKHIFMYVLL